MPLNDFHYGQGAIVAADQQDSFHSCTQTLLADTRPANFLEQLLVDQLLHAQWETRRVNSLTPTPETAEALVTASARASRNWQRAHRELAALQTARASREVCRGARESAPSPCADLTATPKRRSASIAAIDNYIDTLMACQGEPWEVQ